MFYKYKGQNMFAVMGVNPGGDGGDMSEGCPPPKK